VDGTNTLDFVVNNAGTTANPTAVRVELSGTAETLAPPGTPPSIITQPTNRTTQAGSSAAFSVGVFGSRPLFYQWRFNGVPLTGATNSLLAIDCAGAGHAGGYSVLITNAFGSVVSVTATLTVTGAAILSPAQLTSEPPGPSSRRTALTFSEIMYHPTNRADGRKPRVHRDLQLEPLLRGPQRLAADGLVRLHVSQQHADPGQQLRSRRARARDVQAVYGLPVVFGGTTNNATNSLPNQAGTVRLRKRSGAVVLEVNYSEDSPWPAAADGTGHSLALARPTYGENNPRAWTHSAFKGGSPGAADPVPAGALENVVINELLAHSALSFVDFVELFNPNP
jgi:hypothetical protein